MPSYVEVLSVLLWTSENGFLLPTGHEVSSVPKLHHIQNLKLEFAPISNQTNPSLG
jgi:hypothetical protein